MRRTSRTSLVIVFLLIVIIFLQCETKFKQVKRLRDYSARIYLYDVGLSSQKVIATTSQPVTSQGVVSSFPENTPDQAIQQVVAQIPLGNPKANISAPEPSKPDPKPDKVVVVGRLSTEDTTWVSRDLPDWQNAIYVVNNKSAELHTEVNKGHEAFPYLTYIIEHYNELPSTIAFVHSHGAGWPKAWHSDNVYYDSAFSLQNLNLTHVQNEGYVNLRCNDYPGCPVEIEINPKVFNPNKTTQIAMPHVWPVLFGDEPIPEKIGVPCCGQFAVSRNAVLKRPLSDYQRYRDFLVNTDLEDETSGRVFEYLWHIIFGKDPIHCPEMGQCYCQTFGWCFDDDIMIF